MIKDIKEHFTLFVSSKQHHGDNDWIVKERLTKNRTRRSQSIKTYPFTWKNDHYGLATNPAPTPDPACTRRGPAAYADLTFTSDLTTMTGVAVDGSTAWKLIAKLGPEANRMTYHISNLMGGRVYLESDQGLWVAEVILVGSGAPVMWGLRGNKINLGEGSTQSVDEASR